MRSSNEHRNSAEATCLEDYVEAAREHGRGTDIGDSDAANAAYDRRQQVFTQFFADERRELLVPLLEHDNLSVRLFAAVDTYRLDPTRSVQVLEAIAHEPGLVGFNAEMTLQELRSGRLTPP